jgi:hypothetical protein
MLARRRRPAAGPRLLGGVTLALAALLLAPLVHPPVRAQDGRGPTLDQVTENPAAYYNRTVTVAGEVDTVYSPRAFSVEDDDVLFDDDIMVISAQPLPRVVGRFGDAEVLEDDIVLVTGTVRPFNLAEIEREIGVDLDDDLFAYWTGNSAILASSVTVTPRKPGPVGATLDDVLDNPAAFYGRSVVVSGEVDEILGPRAFTIEDDDPVGADELLIVTARERPALVPRLAQEPLADDDSVQVRGPVRRFNLAEFEREIGFDLDDALFADWDGRPAIIARSLQLLPAS